MVPHEVLYSSEAFCLIFPNECIMNGTIFPSECITNGTTVSQPEGLPYLWKTQALLG